METQFEFEYNFEGQNAPYNIPSTGSIPEPYTPNSGRSTPAFFNMPMEHGNLGHNFAMGITPPPSAFRPYSTYNSKPEASQYTAASHAVYVSDMATPPLEFPPVTYPADSVPYNSLPSWAWPADNGSAMFFDTTQTGVFSEAYPPQQYQAVQERSTALHRVQRSGRATKRSQMPIVMVARKAGDASKAIQASLCVKGKFKCPQDGCKSTFMRQEHLKRHVKTVHIKDEKHQCPFCPRGFSRTDNRRNHVRIHDRKDGTGRTKFHPDARAWLDAENARTNRSRRGKKTEHRKTAKPKRAAR
ncbi:hypothetical protein F5X98DRAFT_383033 [Xylaria grammica]|nr:hypothetical protein F5X98DRAFT_383033 [Xylaria grammica]